MWKQRTPSELAHFVPEPVIILFGCRPLVPFQPGWHDRPSGDQHYRAPARSARPGDRFWPPEHCPACRGKIGQPCVGPGGREAVSEIDHRVYCGVCGSMDAKNEANAMAQRIEAESLLRHEESRRQVDRALNGFDPPRRSRPRLSEPDRRRIWNGYKGSLLAPSVEVTNRAKVGREFLTRIGQEPDWSLILDAGGKVVGRYAQEPVEA